uniref:[histone H3]-lysine(27) N-trimethyltransferase n=1 Tax=Caenorhabditis japonica TaxID=281687 RepID=A0A8R1IVB6_CAEJA
MKRKLRHEKLRRQARDKGLDSAELIAADDKKELKKNAEAVRLEAVTPLTACRHDGPCNPLAANCACSENGVCSYMCKCDINCAQRFPGCNCAAGQCQTKACQCFRARWECNPMTCSSCRCDKIDSQTTGCANYAMTRMIQKRMLCAPSRIAGNGLFLLEGAEKDEFITEYVGERISDDEAERRGAIYDRYHCSYIFSKWTIGPLDFY